MILYALHFYYRGVAYGARETTDLKPLLVLDFASVMEQRRVSQNGKSRFAVYACSESYKFLETTIDSMHITIRTPIKKNYK